MGQREISELLLKLHNLITGTELTRDEIVKTRTIDPDISLIHNAELSGKVSSGDKIPAGRWYKLEDIIDYGPSRNTK
ncbi:MAG: hypothetical protein LBT84_02795 [Spirochaetia bacterium]|jgi:hypothetical protein|nr:hypothetical protein [Spirochaetia bacterium]